MSDAPRATGTPIVLIPGFWLGAWAWDDVANALRAQGREVVALTLPGLEPDHPSRGGVRLDDHVTAIREAIGDGPAVLVAHSGAAFPATAALDRAPQAVAHVVWVDTAPVADGSAMDAELVGDELPLDALWDAQLAQGAMRDLTEEQIAEFRRRAVPEPAGAVRDAVSLGDERRLDVSATLIATSFSAAEYRSYADEGVPFLQGLPEQRALEFLDLPTGHWPMWTRPDELAKIIADVGR